MISRTMNNRRKDRRTLRSLQHKAKRALKASPVVLSCLILLWCYWAFHFRLARRLIQDGHVAQGCLYVVFIQPFFFLCTWCYWKTARTSPGRSTDILRERETQDDSHTDREDAQLLNQEPEMTEGRRSVAILDVEAASESRTSLTLSPPSNEYSMQHMRNAYPLITVKQSGARRYCQKCRTEKFDRTHHCRSCKSCVLKMDHHCPWVNNCVGFYNYKYFYLFFLYGSLLSIYVFCTALPPTIGVFNGPLGIPALDFNWPILLFVSTIFGLFLTAFTLFHTRQLLKNRTTIEFYEEANYRLGRARGGRVDVMRTKNFNPWDLGAGKNFTQVMGSNPATWFLPVGRPQGDGCHFPINEYAYNTLSTDPEDQIENL